MSIPFMLLYQTADSRYDEMYVLATRAQAPNERTSREVAENALMLKGICLTLETIERGDLSEKSRNALLKKIDELTKPFTEDWAVKAIAEFRGKGDRIPF